MPPSFLLFSCNWASCLVILFLILTAAVPSGFSASTLCLVKTAALNLCTPHVSPTSSALSLGICASSSRPAEGTDLQESPCCISGRLRVCSSQLCCLQLGGDSASVGLAKEAGNLVSAKTANTKKKRRTSQRHLELSLASVSGFVEVYPCFCEHNPPREPRVSPGQALTSSPQQTHSPSFRRGPLFSEGGVCGSASSSVARSASCPRSRFDDSQGCLWAGLWGLASLVLCQGWAQVCCWACSRMAKLLLVGSVLTWKPSPEGQALRHPLRLGFSYAKCC